MAWRCSGSSNEELVNNLYKANIIKSTSVKNAMLKVDRKHYLPDSSSNSAYDDTPLPIGHRVTISAPHMHAFALEMLHDKLIDGNKALDVGAGSGYLVACIAHMVGDTGHVIGIEYIPELAKHAKQRLKTDPNEAIQKMVKENRIQVFEGDGWQGFEKEAPYAAIHVGAAAESIPENLIKQLDKNGRLVIPVGDNWEQTIMIVEKDDNGNISKHSDMGVSYVPLVNPTKSK